VGKPRIDLDAQEIVSAYVAGMTCKEIAFVLNTTAQTVRLRLVSMGVELRRRGPRTNGDRPARAPRPEAVREIARAFDLTPAWLKPRFEPGDYTGTFAPFIHLPDATLDALELLLCHPRQVFHVMTHDGDGLLPYAHVSGQRTPVPMINARHVHVNEPFVDRPFLDSPTSPCMRSLDGGRTWAAFKPKKRKANQHAPTPWLHLLKADLRKAGLMS
jgi:hypothetical protein